MKFIHSVIAICLVLITANLYFPTADAEIDGMRWFELEYDIDFVKGVTAVVNSYCETEVIEVKHLPASLNSHEGESLYIRCR